MGTRIGATQANDDASGTVLSTSASISVQAGDAIFVISKWESGSTTDTVTDNAAGVSNSYTQRQLILHTSSSHCTAIHTAIAKASESLTFTQTLGAARDFRRVHVIVGRPANGTTFSYDNSAGNFGSGTACSTGAFSVAGTGGFAVCGVGEFATSTYLPGLGWTEESEANSTYSEYYPITSETSITGNATASVSMDWIAVAAAMKETNTSSLKLAWITA